MPVSNSEPDPEPDSSKQDQKAHKPANASSLSVRSGSDPLPAVNPQFKARRRALPSVEAFVAGIRRGDRVMLGRAITLIESQHPAHRERGTAVVEACLPFSGSALRVGITGVPGVGKSTFIEALGMHLIGEGHRLAVLAIDPSSEQSRGSILGDKTRMERLAASTDAFIRPSPTRGTLGGVARATREAITLCEAAGYDVVFVETVGVGQSETEVFNLVDFFLLLMLPGAGDDLQGIKRGIMERADALVITKADGANLDRVRQARSDYRLALHHYPAAASGFPRKVLTCSALDGTGIADVWDHIISYQQHAQASGYFDERRRQQAQKALHQHLHNELIARFYASPSVRAALDDLAARVRQGSVTPYAASEKLLELYFTSSPNNPGAT